MKLILKSLKGKDYRELADYLGDENNKRWCDYRQGDPIFSLKAGECEGAEHYNQVVITVSPRAALLKIS